MREEQRDEMKETGGLDLDGIHIMTIIGEIEGHQNAAQGTKTTKYEHMIPDLARVEQDDRIRGVLILINTIGADCFLKQADSFSCSGRQSFHWSAACCVCGLFLYCKKRDYDDSSGQDRRYFYRSHTKLSEH